MLLAVKTLKIEAVSYSETSATSIKLHVVTSRNIVRIVRIAKSHSSEIMSNEYGGVHNMETSLEDPHG
jgi:hypothetical protein